MNEVEEGMILSKNIFDTNFQLLLRSGSSLSKRYINKIIELGYPGVYVSDELSSDIVINDIIDDSLRIEAFNVIKETYNNAFFYARNNQRYAPTIPKFTGLVEKLTKDIIASLFDYNQTQINLIDLKVFDDYMITHSVHVGILSLFMGKQLGLDEKHLQQLGVAAFLADVGKMFVDSRIVNKTSRLSDEEMEIMNKHTEFSSDYAKIGNAHPQSYLSILYHHEKIDGTGYPQRRSDKDIPLFSKIIAIADVYDALTSNRPNRPSLLPSEAMEFLMANGGKSFDIHLLQLFTRIIAPYPISVGVVLSNGEKGIVYKNNSDMPLRPIIKIFKDANGNDIPHKFIDLKENPAYRSVTISKSTSKEVHVPKY